MKSALCIRCRRSGFVLKVGLFKPTFECEGCGHVWSYGYDGGQYFSGARNAGNTNPLDWVAHPDITQERIAGRTALSEAEGGK